MGHDVRVRMRWRWERAQPEGMGVGESSKTALILKYDDDERDPKRTYCVLRAWMLWRSSRGRWLQHRASRQRWHDQEKASLRAAIQAFGYPSGTTGSTAADDKIRAWCPDVLA